MEILNNTIDVKSIAYELSDKAKPSGRGGFLTCCPAHDDKKTSLSIAEGSSQPIVAKCFAGCEWKDIQSALIAKGLLPDLKKKSITYNKTKTTSNLPAGIFKESKDGHKLVEFYTYKEGIVGRYEKEIDGEIDKLFLTYFDKYDNGNHKVGTAPSLKEYSLYNLNALKDAHTVWFVEGEKCVNALKKLGITATTTKGGSNNNTKTNLDVLKGKSIVFWRDFDDAGLNYCNNVCDELEKLKCDIEIINVEDLCLNKKDDVVDYLKLNPATSKRDLEALLWNEPEAIDTAAIPDIDEKLIPKAAGINEFITNIASAMDCQKSVPANILILSLCGLLGSRVGVKIWNEINWVSFPNTFGGIVAPPSFGKSPILKAALQPLTEINKRIATEREEEVISNKIEAELIDIEIAELKSKYKESLKAGGKK